MREVVPIPSGRPGFQPGPAVTWGRVREGGRGAGRKGPRWKWLAGNNKCTHWLLNAAHHILGNLEKRSTPPPAPPSTPTPDRSWLSRGCGRQHGRFDSNGLVSSGLTALPGRSDSLQTLSYFRSRKFIKAKTRGDGRGRKQGRKKQWVAKSLSVGSQRPLEDPWGLGHLPTSGYGAQIKQGVFEPPKETEPLLEPPS